MQYVIVGGGIAGLYAALQLIEQHDVPANQITILEKSYRWGRRVQTMERDGIFYEAGAGRFSKNHVLLVGLIERYNLTTKMVPLSKKIQDIQVLDERLMIPTNLDVYFKKLLSLKPKLEDVLGKTLFEMASEMFGIEIATLLKSMHGFDEDFKTAGAFDVLELLRPIYTDAYYILMGGLEQIIRHIVQDLTEYGVNLVLNTKCTGWVKERHSYVLTATNFEGVSHNYDTEKIILALDKWGLLEFEPLKPIHNLLNSVAIVPLTRIYARFPVDNATGFAWFHGIPKTTTNLPIRIFIPMDEKTGMCMISYSDGYHASQWQNATISDEMEGRVMQYIRQLFPTRAIPEPQWIQAIHWAHGVHNWLPMVDSNAIYDQIQNPFENVYICGEAYSRWQEWMEGALETASQVAHKSISKTKTKLKLTLTQVKNNKNKSLTVIHGRIYDLSTMDWIHRHPGGDVIKKAIGIDATHMFEYISHPAYVMNILEDMYVGDLKQ